MIKKLTKNLTKIHCISLKANIIYIFIVQCMHYEISHCLYQIPTYLYPTVQHFQGNTMNFREILS